VQVVIALIVTPDGFPLGYEVLPGNTAASMVQMLNLSPLRADEVMSRCAR
jgi:hypothetical protein